MFLETKSLLFRVPSDMQHFSGVFYYYFSCMGSVVYLITMRCSLEDMLRSQLSQKTDSMAPRVCGVQYITAFMTSSFWRFNNFLGSAFPSLR